MTETTVPALSVDRSSATLAVARGAATGAAIGAAAVTVVAAVARAVDVPMVVEGTRIPMWGYGQAVVMCTAVGTLIALVLQAKAARPRARFVAVATVLTVLSCLPVLGADASSATQLVLVLTHLVGGAAVIPPIARHLSAHRPA